MILSDKLDFSWSKKPSTTNILLYFLFVNNFFSASSSIIVWLGVLNFRESKSWKLVYFHNSIVSGLGGSPFSLKYFHPSSWIESILEFLEFIMEKNSPKALLLNNVFNY